MAIPQLRLFGIKIRMDASWILIALLIAWTLAAGVFPDLYQGLPRTTYWGMAAAAVAGIAVSIVLHELGHSLVAKAFGLPIRSITLFIFGGVAEMETEPRSPWAELVMAVAGPLVSVVLGITFMLMSAASPAAPRELIGVLDYLGTLNLLLAVFNMMPAFPLDGGRVFRAIVWMATNDPYRATRVAARTGEALGLILVGAGAVTALLSGFAGGLWWIVMGWFIYSMARAHRRDADAREALAGARVGDLMTPDPFAVAAAMTVEEFVDTVLARRQHDLFPVVEDGAVIGGVGFKEARAAPRADWSRLTLADIATPIASIPVLAASDPIEPALALMQRGNASRALVLDNGRLSGILTLKDVFDHLRFRSSFPDATPRR